MTVALEPAEAPLARRRASEDAACLEAWASDAENESVDVEALVPQLLEQEHSAGLAERVVAPEVPQVGWEKILVFATVVRPVVQPSAPVLAADQPVVVFGMLAAALPAEQAPGDSLQVEED